MKKVILMTLFAGMAFATISAQTTTPKKEVAKKDTPAGKAAPTPSTAPAPKPTEIKTQEVKGQDIEKRSKDQADKLAKELGLNDDQTKKIAKANTEFQTAIKNASSLPDQKAKSDALRTARDQRTTAYKAALTPEQYTKWEESKKMKMKKTETTKTQAPAEGK